MRNQYNLILILITLLLFSACSSHTPTENSKINNTVTQSEQESLTEKENQQMIDFGKRFNPPNFQVEAFNVQISEGYLIMNLNFTISEELHEFLLQKPVYYFQIRYPEALAKIIMLEQSEIAIGPEVEKGVRSYYVQFKQSISKNLSKEEISKLVGNKDGYQLLVLNKNKYPVHIFDDINGFAKVDPNKSSNIYIDEGK